jgi:hypothetical protein
LDGCKVQRPSAKKRGSAQAASIFDSFSEVDLRFVSALRIHPSICLLFFLFCKLTYGVVWYGRKKPMRGDGQRVGGGGSDGARGTFPFSFFLFFFFFFATVCCASKSFQQSTNQPKPKPKAHHQKKKEKREYMRGRHTLSRNKREKEERGFLEKEKDRRRTNRVNKS